LQLGKGNLENTVFPKQIREEIPNQPLKQTGRANATVERF